MFGIKIRRHDTSYYVASTSRFKSVRLVVLPPEQIRPYAPNPFPRRGVNEVPVNDELADRLS